MRSNSEIEYAQLATTWCFNNTLCRVMRCGRYITLYLSGIFLGVFTFYSKTDRRRKRTRREVENDWRWYNKNLDFLLSISFFHSRPAATVSNTCEALRRRAFYFFFKCTSLTFSIIYVSQRHHQHIICIYNLIRIVHNILFYV